MKKKIQKTAIVLVNCNLRNSIVHIGNIRILKKKLSEIEKYKNSILWSRGLDMIRIANRRHGKNAEFGESEWMIIESDNEKISDVCYLAVFELISGYWRQVYGDDRKSLKIDPNNARVDPVIPLYSLTKRRIKELSGAFSLLDNKHFQISLLRWQTSCRREDVLDSVLDCCSALEALLSISSENRLRISLAVSCLLKNNKREYAQHVYNMYKHRNDFIHGNNIPDVSNDDCFLFIQIVSMVLKSVILSGKIPSGDEISTLTVFGNIEDVK